MISAIVAGLGSRSAYDDEARVVAEVEHVDRAEVVADDAAR